MPAGNGQPTAAAKEKQVPPSLMQVRLHRLCVETRIYVKRRAKVVKTPDGYAVSPEIEYTWQLQPEPRQPRYLNTKRVPVTLRGTP